LLILNKVNMKELEKTRRISIAAVLFILVIIIALLSYKRPKHVYALNTQHTLEKITTDNYFVTLDEIQNPNYVLIDIRDQFDYEKGHLEGAVNIYTPELLSEINSDVLNELKENNKTIVLYGNNPTEANSPFLLLYQLGYTNIKILLINSIYSQNKLITKNTTIEKSVADINAFIKESKKNASKSLKPKQEVKKPLKKITPIKKKKKMPVEGGC